MSAQYERICDEERRRKGLLILSARYGHFEGDDSPMITPTTSQLSPNSSIASNSYSQQTDEMMIIDVTIPLQCLIRDGRLRLHKSSKVYFELKLWFSIQIL